MTVKKTLNRKRKKRVVLPRVTSVVRKEKNHRGLGLTKWKIFFEIDKQPLFIELELVDKTCRSFVVLLFPRVIDSFDLICFFLTTYMLPISHKI